MKQQVSVKLRFHPWPDVITPTCGRFKYIYMRDILILPSNCSPDPKKSNVEQLAVSL